MRQSMKQFDLKCVKKAPTVRELELDSVMLKDPQLVINAGLKSLHISNSNVQALQSIKNLVSLKLRFNQIALDGSLLLA